MIAIILKLQSLLKQYFSIKHLVDAIANTPRFTLRLFIIKVRRTKLFLHNSFFYMKI